ncbi:hypothetical protein [Endozoicomonas elysicola]|uniref:Uncharacterized protein n=1 Tax=Endozoicomonas elysicola TaxID=305900 RepID=A0A081KA84_9GAMM|nr:hypothetical protein [Endozoicomonas elysicola]KEI71060.1 hypothetical protein GV64_10150 [Endozoicomonas elysicola]
MSELNLRLIATGDPSSLEQILQCSSENGLHLKSFAAELNTQKNQYEIKMCVCGFSSQHQIVGRLAQQEYIRELSPVKPRGLL